MKKVSAEGTRGKNPRQPTQVFDKTQRVPTDFLRNSRAIQHRLAFAQRLPALYVVPESLMNIEHIALNVPDPVAMAAWYLRHLGLRVLRKQEQAPFTHFIADQAGRVVLELYLHAKAVVPDYAKLDPLTLHIAFMADDVARERQRLLDAGATPAGEIVTTDTGDLMTFVRDPWSVTIQLVKRVMPMI
jgi:glyoxylase I family protein